MPPESACQKIVSRTPFAPPAKFSSWPIWIEAVLPMIFDQWYFHGDLGELLIFNAALRPKEVHDLSEQLMDRYGIPTSVQERQAL